MTMMFLPVRSDTLPENTRYSDDGCDVASACLNCPLTMCKYDDPGWLRRQDRGQRDNEIFRLRKAGVPVPELAKQFKVSTRTVHRIVQRGGAESSESDVDDGPVLSLADLSRRQIIQPRPPLPSLAQLLRYSA